MHTFIIQCADRNSGKPYNIRVSASDAEGAMKQAVSQGHMVGGKPVLESDASTPVSTDADAARHEELERDLRRLTGEVIAIRGELANYASRPIIRSPIGTIATGIVVGLIAWTIVVVLFWVSLAGLFAAALRH